ncbi:hypothetical protein [Brevibacillus formosus]|nr:hypothetical protein [Brevibacillus formosus]
MARYANITDFNQAHEQLADEVKADYVDFDNAPRQALCLSAAL